jgi:hypothetical protein
MERFGKWEVVRPLGRGGQGTVYLARDCEQFDIEKLKLEIGDLVRQIPGIHRADIRKERAEALAKEFFSLVIQSRHHFVAP